MLTLRSMKKDLEMKGFYKDQKTDLVETLPVSDPQWLKALDSVLCGTSSSITRLDAPTP